MTRFGKILLVYLLFGKNFNVLWHYFVDLFSIWQKIAITLTNWANINFVPTWRKIEKIISGHLGHTAPKSYAKKS